MKTRRSEPSFPADLAFVLGPFLAAIPMILTSLRGWPWVAASAVAVLTVAIGGSLIFRAKWPVYREKRFFTFGARALPDSSIPLYQRGWWYVISGAAVAVMLLVGRGG